MTFGIVLSLLIVLGICWAVFEAAHSAGQEARDDDLDGPALSFLGDEDDDLADEGEAAVEAPDTGRETIRAERPTPSYAAPTQAPPQPHPGPQHRAHHVAQAEKPLTAHAQAATQVEELKGQLAAGVINQAEFDLGRQAIIDAM